MAAARVAAKAPKFSIPTTGGEFRLGDQGDMNLVIYFYPRDNTPGCTLEGSDFRDLAPAFRRARTRILGISTDTLESHRKFKDKKIGRASCRERVELCRVTYCWQESA